jgi:hypothetical protein
MGKRGPHEDRGGLWFWAREWFFVFKGMRDGKPSVEVEAYNYESRKLSTHPALAQELRHELRMRIIPVPRRTIGVPAERKLWDALLRASTLRQVRAICQRSKYWLNPKWRGKVYVRDLYEHADQFLNAKKARRYPRSERPSSDDRRLKFLAAAMAGIAVGRGLRTAIKWCSKPSPKLGKRFWEPIFTED